MRLMTGLLVVALFLSSACRKAEPPPAAGHGEHPAGTPAARTTLLGNLGSYQRTITTTSADAQKFFDEGLTLLYGFNHEEAYRSFEQAAALDPKAPMPHWGMSLALGTNYNDTATPDRVKQAHTHLTHAQERAANGSEVERAFIDALAKRYVATPDDGKQTAREEAYAAAMGQVSKRFPDDLDAATLYAESMMNLRPWKLHALDGTPAPGTDRHRRDARKRLEAADAIIPVRITTTSTPSRRRGRPSARSRARSVSIRSCPGPVISSTCPRTSTSAPATTARRRKATRWPRPSTRNTCRRPAPRGCIRPCTTGTTCSFSLPPR